MILGGFPSELLTMLHIPVSAQKHHAYFPPRLLPCFAFFASSRREGISLVLGQKSVEEIPGATMVPGIVWLRR